MPAREKVYTGTNKLDHFSGKLVLQGEKTYTGTNKLEHFGAKLVPFGEKAHLGTKKRICLFYWRWGKLAIEQIELMNY